MKRHLRFSQTFSLNKRSTRSQITNTFTVFSLSLLVLLLFAWCLSLRRGAFLKYDLTIVLLHYTLSGAAAHRVSSLFSPIHPVLLLLIMLVVLLISSAFSDFFLAAAAPYFFSFSKTAPLIFCSKTQRLALAVSHVPSHREIFVLTTSFRFPRYPTRSFASLSLMGR